MRTSPQISGWLKSRSSGEPVGIVPAWAVQPVSPAQAQAQAQSPKASVRTNGRHNDTNERTPAPEQRDSATAFWNLWDVGSLFLAFGKARRAISHLLVTRQSTSPVALTDKDFTETARSSRNSNAWAAARGRRALVRTVAGPLVGSLATCSR